MPGRGFETVMTAKRSKSLTIIVVLLLCAVVGAALVFVLTKFEGETPALQFEGTIDSIGAAYTLKGLASDQKSGLRRIWIALLQGGKEKVLFDQTFPSRGFLGGGDVESVPFSIDIKADELGLVDGEALLRAAAWDYSYRGWWKGNQAYFEQEVAIDTQPPVIDVLSRTHNLNVGGSGLAVYRVSEPCSASGIQAGQSFFPGYAGFSSDPNLFIAFFALSHTEKPDVEIWATATDHAGNTGRAGMAYHVNAKRFRRDKIVLSDSFLKRNMPELSRFLSPEVQSAPLVDRFLAINNGLRKANHEVFKQATGKSDTELHWDGSFARLQGSARMAGFADHRRYEYDGKIIDEQVHLGIDLASTAQAPVPAANHGRVVLAEYVGIYGNAVVLDHGFGLFSMYGHLSRIEVKKDQVVAKGDIIGYSGSTGLAGGDHLHYGMMIQQTFVNPVEWWDSSWIKNNVTTKLQEVPRGVEG